MKCIVKREAPSELLAWVEQKLTLGERADFRLGIPGAESLRRAALREQYGLCAYTGRAITDCTLEHIKPYTICKSEWIDDQLAGEDVSWDNLVGAFKTYQEPHYGESIRADWYDENYISPLEPDCDLHFTFDLNGCIGSTSARGASMIVHLQLNHSRLNEDRLAAINAAIEQLVAEFEDHGSIAAFLSNACAIVGDKLPSFSFVLESALPQLA